MFTSTPNGLMPTGTVVTTLVGGGVDHRNCTRTNIRRIGERLRVRYRKTEPYQSQDQGHHAVDGDSPSYCANRFTHVHHRCVLLIFLKFVCIGVVPLDFDCRCQRCGNFKTKLPPALSLSTKNIRLQLHGDAELTIQLLHPHHARLSLEGLVFEM